ncbi:MAG: hypothetical protein H0T68_12725, partial [Gemmatimonadales bacterium]|nr:hypothetical protein [Gemmatimonadales bacterium]
MIVHNLGELMRPATRRSFVRTLLAGGTVVMLPSVFTACGDDDDGGMGPDPVTGISFDLRTDAGIFRIVDVLEQLEGFYYTEVVTSP